MKGIPRPSGILLDVGNTILREDHYDLAPGLASLEPLSEKQPLVARLEAEINQVHTGTTAEFNLARWLAQNRSSFARVGSAQELERLVWSETVSLSPMPGVSEALSRLAQEGLALACISNAVFSGSVLQSELEHHGLFRHLRFVLSSADIGCRKPDIRIFSEGLTMLGLASSSVWFVGDSWSADIQGATAAGLFPVWFSEAPPPNTALHYAQAGSWFELCSLVSDSTAS